MLRGKQGSEREEDDLNHDPGPPTTTSVAREKDRRKGTQSIAQTGCVVASC